MTTNLPSCSPFLGWPLCGECPLLLGYWYWSSHTADSAVVNPSSPQSGSSAGWSQVFRDLPASLDGEGVTHIAD